MSFQVEHNGVRSCLLTFFGKVVLQKVRRQDLTPCGKVVLQKVRRQDLTP